MSRIGDQRLLRGVPLVCLLEPGVLLAIERRLDLHEAVYTVFHDSVKSAFLIKTSTSPKRWQFTFTEVELAALASGLLSTDMDRRFVALVCKTDGVCCLSIVELNSLFNGIAEGSKSVGVSRPPRGSYHLSGPGRTPLGYAIPASDWPLRILSKRHK
jgi:hypothetical protein